MCKYFLTISLFLLCSLGLNAQFVIAGQVTAGSDSSQITPVPDWPVSIIGPDGQVVELVFTLESGFFFWESGDFELIDGQGWAVSTQDPCTFGAVGESIILQENVDVYEVYLNLCAHANPPGGNDLCQAFLGSNVDFESPEPYTVEFFNLSSVSQEVTQVWNFGDGNSSTEENPVHVYDEPGTYEVSLTITGDSCTSTATSTITLSFDCNCDAEPSDPVCYFFDLAGEIINFDNLCEALCVGLSEEDVFNCDLDIYSCLGSIQSSVFPGELEVDFLYSFFDPEGSVDSISWDFGDGNFSNDLSPTHVYDDFGVYEVTAYAYNFATGCSNIQYATLHLSEQEPSPFFCESLFFFYQLNPEDMMSFEFLALDFFFTGDHSWDFGDGNTATGVEVSHTYNETGTYIVTLTTSDGADCTSTYTMIIEVGENNFYGTESCRTVMLPIMSGEDSSMTTVEFIPFFLSSDIQGPTALDTILVSWDFGDGNTSTELQPVHTYASPGVYTATLTISDGLDCENTIAVIINLETGEFSAVPSYTTLSSTRESRTLEGLTISPNPSNGFYAVEWATSEASPTLDWTLMNTTGRIVRSGTTEAAQHFDLDISDQPNGTYLLRMESERGVSTRRLIKTF